MEEYDIALISPPSRMVNHYRPPLALMYVAEYYRRKKLNVKIIDVPMRSVVRNRKFWKNKQSLVDDIKIEMLRQVMEAKPRLIGISCYSTEFDEVKDLIDCIRKIIDAKIIVGGVHPTLYPDEFQGISDYVYRGRLDNGYPFYNGVDMHYYSNANPYAIRGVYLRCAYVLASFGCPSQCTFCVAPRLREHFGIEQFKKPSSLYEEVLYLKRKYEVDGFYLIDDLYTLDKVKLLEFCNLVRPLGMLWGCSSKVTTLNEDMIKAMADSGCVQIDFGIERGSNESLKILKKGITVEKVKEICSLCHRYGIRIFTNFLVGLPKESEKDFRDIQSLLQEIKPEVVSINKFSPYRGTQIYEEGFKEVEDESLDRWMKKTMRRYNKLMVGIRFHLSRKYLSVIMRSKRKWNYITQLGVLCQEIMNQKF